MAATGTVATSAAREAIAIEVTLTAVIATVATSIGEIEGTGAIAIVAIETVATAVIAIVAIVNTVTGVTPGVDATAVAATTAIGRATGVVAIAST